MKVHSLEAIAGVGASFAPPLRHDVMLTVLQPWRCPAISWVSQGDCSKPLVSLGPRVCRRIPDRGSSLIAVIPYQDAPIVRAGGVAIEGRI